MKIFSRVLTYAAAIFFTVIFAFPLVFMAVSSLKPDFNLLQDTGSFRAFLPLDQFHWITTPAFLIAFHFSCFLSIHSLLQQ